MKNVFATVSDKGTELANLRNVISINQQIDEDTILSSIEVNALFKGNPIFVFVFKKHIGNSNYNYNYVEIPNEKVYENLVKYSNDNFDLVKGYAKYIVK